MTDILFIQNMLQKRSPTLQKVNKSIVDNGFWPWYNPLIDKGIDRRFRLRLPKVNKSFVDMTLDFWYNPLINPA